MIPFARTDKAETITAWIDQGSAITTCAEPCIDTSEASGAATSNAFVRCGYRSPCVERSVLRIGVNLVDRLSETISKRHIGMSSDSHIIYSTGHGLGRDATCSTEDDDDAAFSGRSGEAPEYEGTSVVITNGQYGTLVGCQFFSTSYPVQAPMIAGRIDPRIMVHYAATCYTVAANSLVMLYEGVLPATAGKAISFLNLQSARLSALNTLVRAEQARQRFAEEEAAQTGDIVDWEEWEED